MEHGRIPNAAHESHPWRIREIVSDFELEDAWALPVQGGHDDFPALLELMATSNPGNAESMPTRLLWSLRDRLGEWFDLGRISTSVESDPDDSLAGRLPDDLRDTVAGVRIESLPFVPLYRTDTEFAAEVSNRTVHGVMHLGWAELGEGRYQGQMAVYVKPRGLFGRGYMALIKPFRLWIVYPALMRQTERTWNRRRPTAPLDVEPGAS